MRHIISAIVLTMSPLVGMAADSYTIDPLHTFPNFTISHLGYSTMHGRFGKTEGKMSFDEAQGTGSVSITIDAASVSTGYIKRDNHLRSPDFLNANEFPEITYKSTKAKIDKDGSGTVNGELTIAGVTKPVTLKVTRMHCAANPMKQDQYRCGFDAETAIKRSEFGIKYGLPAIGDDMSIALEVEAVRN